MDSKLPKPKIRVRARAQSVYISQEDLAKHQKKKKKKIKEEKDPLALEKFELPLIPKIKFKKLGSAQYRISHSESPESHVKLESPVMQPPAKRIKKEPEPELRNLQVRVKKLTLIEIKALIRNSTKKEPKNNKKKREKDVPKSKSSEKKGKQRTRSKSTDGKSKKASAEKEPKKNEMNPPQVETNRPVKPMKQRRMTIAIDTPKETRVRSVFSDDSDTNLPTSSSKLPKIPVQQKNSTTIIRIKDGVSNGIRKVPAAPPPTPFVLENIMLRMDKAPRIPKKKKEKTPEKDPVVPADPDEGTPSSPVHPRVNMMAKYGTHKVAGFLDTTKKLDIFKKTQVDLELAQERSGLLIQETQAKQEEIPYQKFNRRRQSDSESDDDRLVIDEKKSYDSDYEDHVDEPESARVTLNDNVVGGKEKQEVSENGPEKIEETREEEGQFEEFPEEMDIDLEISPELPEIPKKALDSPKISRVPVPSIQQSPIKSHETEISMCPPAIIPETLFINNNWYNTPKIAMKSFKIPKKVKENKESVVETEESAMEAEESTKEAEKSTEKLVEPEEVGESEELEEPKVSKKHEAGKFLMEVEKKQQNGNISESDGEEDDQDDLVSLLGSDSLGLSPDHDEDFNEAPNPSEPSTSFSATTRDPRLLKSIQRTVVVQNTDKNKETPQIPNGSGLIVQNSQKNRGIPQMIPQIHGNLQTILQNRENFQVNLRNPGNLQKTIENRGNLQTNAEIQGSIQLNQGNPGSSTKIPRRPQPTVQNGLPTMNGTTNGGPLFAPPVKIAVPNAQPPKDLFQIHSSDEDDFGMFDEICKSFLATGTCPDEEVCYQEHQLPDSSQVQDTIKNLKAEKIEELYEGFLLKFPCLFNAHFDKFAKKVGSLKLHQRLHKMIVDCELRKRLDFWKYVVEGLELSGYNRFHALQFLLEHSRVRTADAIDEILHLIIMPPTPLETVVVMIGKIQELTAFPGYVIKNVPLDRLIYLAGKYGNISLIFFLLQNLSSHTDTSFQSQHIPMFLETMKQVLETQNYIAEYMTNLRGTG